MVPLPPPWWFPRGNEVLHLKSRLHILFMQQKLGIHVIFFLRIITLNKYHTGKNNQKSRWSTWCAALPKSRLAKFNVQLSKSERSLHRTLWSDLTIANLKSSSIPSFLQQLNRKSIELGCHKIYDWNQIFKKIKIVPG